MNSLRLLLLSFLFFTSCATITRGVHEKLKVVSDPPAADVVLSSGETGVTPAEFVKKRKESFSVTISKSGYVAQTVAVESRFSGTGGAAMAGNVLIGGVIGVGVDAATGAVKSHYPNPVSVTLVPRGKGSRAKDRSSRKKAKSAGSATNPTPPAKPES